MLSSRLRFAAKDGLLILCIEVFTFSGARRGVQFQVAQSCRKHEGDRMRTRVVLVSLLLVSLTVYAQTFRGTILGTVTDASGAVVSGAKVTVRNVGTGLERSTQTSPDGRYSLPELPIGTYTVTATQSGFQTSVTKNVVVDVAAPRRVDATLKAGQVSTTVEVSGEELPQVETTIDTLGTTFTAQQAKDF